MTASASDDRVFLTLAERRIFGRWGVPVRYVNDRLSALGATCAFCGKPSETVAHRIPYQKGILRYSLTPSYLNRDQNLVATCRECNKKAEWTDEQVSAHIEILRPPPAPPADLEAEIRRVHWRFYTQSEGLLAWLDDNIAAWEQAPVNEKNSRLGTVQVVGDAVSVLLVGAFESFIKDSVEARTGLASEVNVSSYEDAEDMVRDAWGIQIGALLRDKARFLNFLMRYRHIIAYNGHVADEAFRRALVRDFGPDALDTWRSELPQELDGYKVKNLANNLMECERLIFHTMHPKPFFEGPLGALGA